MPGHQEIEKFFSENIGVVVSFDDESYSPYRIRYFPENSKLFNEYRKKIGYDDYDSLNTIDVTTEEIKFFAKTKEELETILAANKYNL